MACRNELVSTHVKILLA